MSYKLIYPDRIDYNSGSRRKNHSISKYYRKEEPYICSKCKKVWQFAEQCKYTEYLKDFPKYGCTNRICKNCKG